MIRVFALLALLILASIGRAAEADEAFVGCARAVIGADDATPLVRFDRDFRGALARRDVAAIALLTQFPLRVNFADDSVVMLANPSTLQNQFERVFTPALREEVSKQAAGDLVCKYSDGMGYANGGVWVHPAGADDKQLRIVAVNVPGGSLHPPKAGAIDLACSTKQFRIVIDAAAKPETWRYRVWNLPRGLNEKPDLELIGTRDFEGTSPCTHRIWRFKNGKTEYELSEPGCGQDEPPKNAVASLDVRIDGKEQLNDWCF